MDKTQLINAYQKLITLASDEENDRNLIDYLRTFDTDDLSQLLSLSYIPGYSTFSNLLSVFAGGTVVAVIFSLPTGDDYKLITFKLYFCFVALLVAFWVIIVKNHESRLKNKAALSVKVKVYKKTKVQTCNMFVLNEKYGKFI